MGLRSFEEARRDASYWGRLVENAVGARLLNDLQDVTYEITYWRERDQEVDFVVRRADALWAIEVKSGFPRKPGGLEAFRRRQPKAIPLVVGAGGIPLDEFLGSNTRELLASLLR